MLDPRSSVASSGLTGRRCSSAGAVVLLMLSAIPRARAGTDDEASVNRERCRLARGKTGHVVTETSAQSCGSGGCSQSQTITLFGPGDVPLIVVENQDGDFADGPGTTITCNGGVVEVMNIGDEKTPLKLRYDADSGALKLGPELAAMADKGWKRPPVTDAGEIAKRATLSNLAAAVLPGAAANGATPSPSIAGLDADLVASLRLLAARDKIAAGAWESAVSFMESAASIGGAKDGNNLSAALNRRRAELTARLAAERKRTQPVRLDAGRRLGTTAGEQDLPIYPEGAPTLFWRGDELCVVQEETPPHLMRCYAPAARHWSASVPIALPASSGQNLRSMTFPNVDRCDGTYLVRKTAPEDATPCGEGQEEAERLVAVVEHDAMVLRSDKGLYVDRGPGKQTALSVAEANALLRASAGSLVLGDGCCTFLEDGRVARINEDPEKRWQVLGAPPGGEHWIAPPLASPDQRWILARSRANGGRVTLWLFRATPPR